jgi:tetratricopeptide (TPR) repeat protein
VTLGLSQDPLAEAGPALEQTRRALDAAPDCALALAMEGFAHCHMLRDLDGADQRIDEALRINPNESVAWLYKCVTQGFRGLGSGAMVSAERAIFLSPLDPMRHYYDGLAASAALAMGNLDRAIFLAKRSLDINRNHLPTLRALAIAQVESGALEDARETVARVLMLEPRLTARDYVARGPKGAEETRLRYAAALREAGVPAE